MFIYVFAVLLFPLGIYSLARYKMIYGILILIAYDVLFLIYVLYIYYFNIYYWFQGLFPIVVSIMTIILNIIFGYKCIYHKKYQYLFLLILPITFVITGINRIDKTILLHNKLSDAREKLNLINENNGELINTNTELKYNCNGNNIYAFVLQEDIANELVGSFMDTKTAIVYDKFGLLNEAECDVITGLFNSRKLIKVKKLKDDWYLCVF